MIYLENIVKEFPNKTRALNGINLHIKPKEFAIIVGRSGAGKSTLIQLITKQEEPTKGNIYVGGINYKELRKGDLPYIRRKIGVVFQDFKLLPKKTVYENVSYALEVSGVKSSEIKSRVPKILDIVGLANKAKNFPNELSGGEQQRVAIARALVHQPKILIADEPTGNLDPKTAWGIMDLLMKINEQGGRTVVLTTHNKEIVDKVKKRVITIKNGKVVSDQQGGGYTA
ncbi:cell division ATP-binding protein FtsE [bacterium (Candidatus Howlettbacteria) CG_4_10_14_0_8_um_filter_40_9]|nr:MAG: cell division ATP-binding protein FtsE [bacterium (Candidatus Howlettbacteria) CG_4_10_14_0_8_um_filter_40_9]